MKNCLPFIVFFFYCQFYYSQIPNGPAGVGSSSDVQIWLDATDISASDGDAISNWSDASGNGNNFTQSSAPLQPTYSSSSTINSGPAVNFANDHMVSGSISALESNQLSWIVVLNTNNTSTQIVNRSNFNSGAGVGSNTLLGNYTTSTLFRSHTRESGSNMCAVDDSYQLGSHIWTSIWDGTTSFRTYIDESLVGESFAGSASPSGHNYTLLGANNLSNQYSFIGDIAECIFYSININNAQRIILDNYLSTKYAISLSGNDKFAHDGTHGNELAGIGREDASNEHLDAQGESIVRISATSLDDGDYLMWGHDNGNLISTTSGIPTTGFPITGAMLERKWRVTETGETGNLTISFDLSTGLAFGDPSEYYLLIDNDDDFTDAGFYGPVSISSDIVTFSILSTELDDGDYFTLANGDAEIISIVSGQTWNDPTTWNCNCIPNLGSNVTIDVGDQVRVLSPSNALNLDVSNLGQLSLFGTTLNIAGDLDMQSGSTNFLNGFLDVEGNITNSGTATSSGSYVYIGGNWDNSLGTYNYAAGDSITFDGITASTISGATEWNILTIDNTAGVTVSSGAQDVYGILNIVSGTFTTGSLVTLKSNSTTGTAQMDDLESGDISGNLNVERLLSMTTQGWREITSPVQGTVILDWQNNGIDFSGFTNSTFPTFPFVNAYTYFEPNALGDKNNGWVAANDANSDPTGPSSGHRVYMDATDFTLSVAGNPYKGSQVLNVTQTGGAGTGDEQNGWNLIGNPYPCTVDWDLLSSGDKNNIEDAIWIWNATVGNYGLYNTSGSTNNVTNEIAHSQAFWVKAISNTGSVTFNESDKVRSDKPFVKSFPDNENMIVSLTSTVNNFKDELVIKRQAGASLFYDLGLDFSKLFTELPDEAPSLSVLTNDNVHLSIASVDKSNSSTIQLMATAGLQSQGNYTLNFDIPSSFIEKGCIHLEDIHTGVITDLRVDSSYTFVSSDTTTVPRFLLHIFRDYDINSSPATCYGLDDGSIIIEGDSIDNNSFDLYNNGIFISTLAASGNSLIFDNLFAGDYEVYTSQSLLCNNNIINVSVYEPEEVLAEFSVNNDTLLIGIEPAQLQLTNNSYGATDYTWDFDDGNFSNETHPIHFYSTIGSYTIGLTANNTNLPLCYDEVFQNILVIDSNSLSIENPVNNTLADIEYIRKQNEVIFHSSFDQKNVLIQIFNSLGQLIIAEEIDFIASSTNSIPLKQGNQIYFIVLSSKEAFRTIKLF